MQCYSYSCTVSIQATQQDYLATKSEGRVHKSLFKLGRFQTSMSYDKDAVRRLYAITSFSPANAAIATTRSSRGNTGTGSAVRLTVTATIRDGSARQPWTWKWAEPSFMPSDLQLHASPDLQAAYLRLIDMHERHKNAPMPLRVVQTSSVACINRLSRRTEGILATMDAKATHPPRRCSTTVACRLPTPIPCRPNPQTQE